MQPGYSSEVPAKSYTVDEAAGQGKTRECHFWKKGTCNANDKCKFLHIGPKGSEAPGDREGVPDSNGGTKGAELCRNWMKKRCTYKEKQCRFSHPNGGAYKERGQQRGGAGKSQRDKKDQGKGNIDGGSAKRGVCYEYVNKGTCSGGRSCPRGQHDPRMRDLKKQLEKLKAKCGQGTESVQVVDGDDMAAKFDQLQRTVDELSSRSGAAML